MAEVWVEDDDIEKALVILKQRVNRDLIMREIKTRNSFPKRSCRIREKQRLNRQRIVQEEKRKVRRAELKRKRARIACRAI